MSLRSQLAPELLIAPRKGWEPLRLRELWEFRELLGFLVWRDVKIRYKQTLLGGLWAILQPLMGMLVFGGLLRLVGLPGVSDAPFMLFVYSGLVIWTFFANSVAIAGNSMIGNEGLIRKIYFPRVLIPLASIAALALDLIIGTGFMGLLMVYFRWPPSGQMVLLPFFALAVFCAAAGAGMFLAALNVRFRDVKYAVPFLLQIGMFVTPVVYPLGNVPEKLRLLLSLNPMAGLVEGWRSAALGRAMDWPAVGAALLVSAALFVGGFLFFHRMERMFADEI